MWVSDTHMHTKYSTHSATVAIILYCIVLYYYEHEGCGKVAVTVNVTARASHSAARIHGSPY